MASIRVPFDLIKENIAATLTAVGVTVPTAQSVAFALAKAEANGKKGHGIVRVPSYVAQVRSGKVKADAKPLLTQPKPSVLAIDAGYGFAYPAFDLLVESLPPLVEEMGVAMAGVYHSHHFGVAGQHVECLAGQGLVALLFGNTPAAIAPWGGQRPLFGTNPLAFAAPIKGRSPLVIDLATSAVARGKILQAAQKGEAIPEGWALDSEGNPTTDADAALKGSMVAFGGAKGAALAMMIEVLAAALTGGNFGYEASSFITPEGPPPDTGQIILAIDSNALSVNFLERMADFAGMIENEGARLPGSK